MVVYDQIRRTEEVYSVRQGAVWFFVDWIDGKPADTEVDITISSFWIAGQERERFLTALRNLLDEFAI